MKYFSLFGCLPLFLFSFNLRAQSIFPEKIEDEKAVYFQAGQFPIHADGNQIEMIEVPQRPSSITFGGKDGNTLFITARSSLYGIELSEL